MLLQKTLLYTEPTLEFTVATYQNGTSITITSSIPRKNAAIGAILY